jgi:hypothetical protein
MRLSKHSLNVEMRLYSLRDNLIFLLIILNTLQTKESIYSQSIVTHHQCVALLKSINKMKSPIFYCEQELKELNDLLLSDRPLPDIIKEQSIRWRRTEYAVKRKMLRLRQDTYEQRIPIIEEQKPSKIKVVKSTSPYFYSNEEIEDMKMALSTSNKSVRVLIREHASKWNRGITGLSHKMYKVAKEVKSTRTKIHIDKNFVKKETIEKRVPIIKEVPQTIGIDVPEGTSFDIQNVKRVVLQKDCFTIYF